MREHLVRVMNVHKRFPIESGLLSRLWKGRLFIRAVDGISLDINEGDTFALVGESGCGKTTTGLMIAGLIEPTSGRIVFDGKDLFRVASSELRNLRRNMQMIFQDPLSSLNPRKTVGGIIGKQLNHHNIGSKGERNQLISEILENVGLTPASSYVNRFPHEFSGGQQQRIGITRALAVKPRLIITDEPISSLDMSIRSQIINLLQDLKRQFSLTYLLISHDLSVVRYMADRVAVMYLGKIVEKAWTQDLFKNPAHPYTQALIDAVLIPNPSPCERSKVNLKRVPMNHVNPPSGCRLHPRCPYAQHICRDVEPKLIEITTGHFLACHFPAIWKE